MPRRKVAIEAIEGNAKRYTTFTKRRHGLEKKTEEFCRKSESEAVIVTFSKVGNCYVFAHPHMDDVFARYSSALEARTSGGGEEAPPPMAVESLIGEAVEKRDWDEATKDLKLEELDQLIAEINDIMVKAKTKIAAAKIHPPDAGVSGVEGAERKIATAKDVGVSRVGGFPGGGGSA